MSIEKVDEYFRERTYENGEPSGMFSRCLKRRTDSTGKLEEILDIELVNYDSALSWVETTERLARMWDLETE